MDTIDPTAALRNSELQSGNSEMKDLPNADDMPKEEFPNSHFEIPNSSDILRLIEHLEASDKPGVIARNAADHLRQALAPLRQFEVMTAS